ncbi:hypothetical protein L3X38_015347 [Prunus dulcis]|uniref:Uncharacterized protein n=1 Tax=Prunus dulcis TaxID=3755 RepID=A0AAD4ZJB0_PRUDU|nr:hypothetical protein L3X38_015347 [Prunus dulcis]
MAENNNNNNALEGPQNDEDNRSVHNDENRSVHNDENPLVRTLHDYLHPARTSVPSYIIFPLNGQTFDFKSGMIQLLPTFHGMGYENPHSHVHEFRKFVELFQQKGVGLI